MPPQRQTTPEGDAIIAAALAEAAPPDPPPADVPLGTGSAGESDAPTDAPKRRGRPPGSKNRTSGRRPRAARLDDIESAADEAVKRGALLAAYVVSAAPIPPDRKVVWLGDTEIVGSPEGRKAIVGSLRFACERNPKIAAFCQRMIEASAYTGIGATVVFGLVLPIAMNHGLVKLPPQILAMMQEESAEDASEEAA